MGNSATRDVVRSLQDDLVHGLKDDERGQPRTFDGVSVSRTEDLARFWAPDVHPTGRRTWRTSVPWPARAKEYEQLAVRCVDVLRLVHGVPDPEELEYRAWRDEEPPPEQELYYQEKLEPAEPHLTLPRLGLRDAQHL